MNDARQHSLASGTNFSSTAPLPFTFLWWVDWCAQYNTTTYRPAGEHWKLDRLCDTMSAKLSTNSFISDSNLCSDDSR